ncbi:hypothetical protein HNY73_018880 [Argiope bruennichi]|uniref:Gustatory receptor n=1 Tax=Argiope bruennichi TaxID=94029 RepID=A0A8T0EF36_ARGBR|nr:hypothetical protein HNY73_018880 [Argiope bruennichi]
MCLGIIIFKIICLAFKFHWSIFVTISVKVTSLVLWWFVRIRTRDILEMMKQLEYIQAELKYHDFQKALKTSKAAAVFTLLVLCLQPLVLSLRYLKNQGEGLTCSLAHVSSEITAQSILVILLHEYASIYVNTSITYAVALFYSLYCYLFSLCLKKRRRSVFQTFHLYRYVLKYFKVIEKVMSALIFIIIAHFLVSLFKDMMVLINVVQKGRGMMLFSYGFDFLVCGAMITAVILSAERVQLRANSMRRYLTEYVPNDLKISCARMMEDGDRLKLTGWGTFTIRKPLLLTLVTWLISYGIIIFQFSSK